MVILSCADPHRFPGSSLENFPCFITVTAGKDSVYGTTRFFWFCTGCDVEDPAADKGGSPGASVPVPGTLPQLQENEQQLEGTVSGFLTGKEITAAYL